MKETIKIEQITTRRDVVIYTCGLWAGAFAIFFFGVAVGYLWGGM